MSNGIIHSSDYNKVILRKFICNSLENHNRIPLQHFLFYNIFPFSLYFLFGSLDTLFSLICLIISKKQWMGERM